MKVLKIFGVVVGIHVFALILIFANPGCSSTNKAAPSPADTVAKTDDAPAPISSSVPAAGTNQPYVAPSNDSPISPVSSGFDPNASAGAVVRFSPTRPGTPAAATLEAQPVADVTPASTYTVGKGDSLWTIAKKHHITVAELASANNVKAGATVRLGQKLIIPKGVARGATAVAEPAATKSSPAKTAVADAPAPARGSGESVKHVVKPGETLGAIAHKYQVKVGEIATANNISDPAKIRPGMELTIPGWQAPAGKTAKSAGAGARAESKAPAGEPSPVQPAPEQDLDSGLKNNEPPVIKIEDPSAPTKA